MDTPRPLLGDILYADPSRARIAESDWVALVRRIAAGDPLALHALYERANRIVYTLIVRIAGSRETAEEVTLDVFHDVWRRASAYDAASGTVLGWVLDQARSRAIDRLRYEQRKKRVDGEPAALVIDDLVDPLELDQRSRALRDAMSGLTAEERQAIESAFFSDLSHSEVATRLNHPLGTVKTRIRSGLSKLRKALE